MNDWIEIENQRSRELIHDWEKRASIFKAILDGEIVTDLMTPLEAVEHLAMSKKMMKAYQQEIQERLDKKEFEEFRAKK